MSIPESISTTIMNNYFHQQLYKIPSTSNFPINPDLLQELNTRYLHDMNMNRLTTYFHSKNNLSLLEKSIKQNDDHHHPTKKSNKWCTAHVRICWMIYDQQQRLKEKTNDEFHRYYPLLFQKLNSKSSLFSSTIERQQYASLFPSMNFNNSSPLIQYERFLHSQQQQNKSFKTKFDQISSSNHKERKRMKRTTT